jgi:hypothetical protein
MNFEDRIKQAHRDADKDYAASVREVFSTPEKFERWHDFRTDGYLRRLKAQAQHKADMDYLRRRRYEDDGCPSILSKGQS